MPGLAKILKKRARILNGSRNQFDLIVRRVATIVISRYQMPFDRAKHVSQITCVWTIVPFLEFQPQRLAQLLHEIHQLLDFQERNEWIEMAA